MSTIDQTADFASHHIEGFATQAIKRGVRSDFKVPLISEIAPNLWMGGVLDGVELPPEIGIQYVFALYQGERYKLAEGVGLADIRMLDGADVPDGLTAIARAISDQRKNGPVLVHCQAGLNRSSLLVALTLILDNDVESAREAIALIRRKRHEVCLCNEAFENWLLEWDQQPIEHTPEEIEAERQDHPLLALHRSVLPDEFNIGDCIEPEGFNLVQLVNSGDVKIANRVATIAQDEIRRAVTAERERIYDSLRRNGMNAALEVARRGEDDA